MTMKAYLFYTPSHKVLIEEWFKPSLKDDFELVVEERRQTCPSARFMDNGWRETMIHKVDLILRAIEENPGEVFIHSDVDVQFFKPVKDIIRGLIGDKDMVIQRNNASGSVCPGFFAAKGNKKNLRLWRHIRKQLHNRQDTNDQLLLNSVLRSKWNILRQFKFGIKWSHLPFSFYSVGPDRARQWRPGIDLCIPKDIVMHHANWTVGLEQKIAQLRHVKDMVKSRQAK
jgi:hypothetical protein